VRDFVDWRPILARLGLASRLAVRRWRAGARRTARTERVANSICGATAVRPRRRPLGGHWPSSARMATRGWLRLRERGGPSVAVETGVALTAPSPQAGPAGEGRLNDSVIRQGADSVPRRPLSRSSARPGPRPKTTTGRSRARSPGLRAPGRHRLTSNLDVRPDRAKRVRKARKSRTQPSSRGFSGPRWLRHGGLRMVSCSTGGRTLASGAVSGPLGSAPPCSAAESKFKQIPIPRRA